MSPLDRLNYTLEEVLESEGDGDRRHPAVWRLHCEVYSDEGSGGEVVLYAVTEHTGVLPDLRRLNRGMAAGRTVEHVSSVVLVGCFRDPRLFLLPDDSIEDGLLDSRSGRRKRFLWNGYRGRS